MILEIHRFTLHEAVERFELLCSQLLRSGHRGCGLGRVVVIFFIVHGSLRDHELQSKAFHQNGRSRISGIPKGTHRFLRLDYPQARPGLTNFSATTTLLSRSQATLPSRSQAECSVPITVTLSWERVSVRRCPYVLAVVLVRHTELHDIIQGQFH